jgi:ParB-like chromosome segregation protein Spo0J
MNTNRYAPHYKVPALEDAIAAVTSRINGVHEACSSVHTIAARDFDQLVDSIKTHGLLRPIEIDSNGLLLDGRCRLQACMLAGVKLGDSDIVVTDADPEVIAASNNARRHLSVDQKVMEAVRLLAREKELAAQRKIEGARKGRLSKQSQLGTNSVPSETQPKKREPRAKDKVAAETGVSREQLTLAEKIAKADPEAAKKVEQGELSLKEAAEKTDVVDRKGKKPSPAAPAAPVPTKKLAKSKLKSEQTQWKDDFTEVIDMPNGVRIIRSKAATFYINKTTVTAGFVLPVELGWWWLVDTESHHTVEEDREDAEKSTLARIAGEAKEQ